MFQVALEILKDNEELLSKSKDDGDTMVSDSGFKRNRFHLKQNNPDLNNLNQLKESKDLKKLEKNILR